MTVQSQNALQCLALLQMLWSFFFYILSTIEKKKNLTKNKKLEVKFLSFSETKETAVENSILNFLGNQWGEKKS